MTSSERRDLLRNPEVHGALTRLSELWTDNVCASDASTAYLEDVDDLVRDELENLLVGLEIGREDVAA